MIDVVHDLDQLLLDSECLNGDFASNEGDEISNRVQLQEAVNGHVSWSKPYFFHHRVLEMGCSFGIEVLMWSLLK